MQEDALAQHERTARISGVGADSVVRVVRVKATEHDLHAIRFVVAIGVGQQHKVWLLRNIDAFWGNLEANGQMQFVGKHSFLVSLTVAIRVLVD